MMLRKENCTKRLEALKDRLRARGIPIAIVSDPKHVYYFTGLLLDLRTPGLVMVDLEEGDALIVPESQVQAGKARFAGRVIGYENYSIHRIVHPEERLWEAWSELAKKRGITGTVGIEKAHLSVRLREVLSGDLVDLSSDIVEMRTRKDADEVALIERCARWTDVGYSVAEAVIAEGKTELDIYAEVLSGCTKAAGVPLSLDGDFVSGERSIGIGGGPTDRTLREGDLFIFDLYPTYFGYRADTCRTLVVGVPNAKQIEVYDLLRRALEAGEEKLRPGVRAKDVYQRVYESIAHAGYGAHFPHHAGHGIGLKAPEAPFLIPGSDEVLEEGMVVTLEPGIYLPGLGGLRMEDDYLITSDGPRVLSHFSRTL